MRLEATLIGKAEHLVVHPRRIADAQHVDTSIHEFLRNPIHRHVALCTYQHLALSHQRLVDGFHERGGLACARRSMHNGNILRPQHLVDRLLLSRIEPRETHRFEGKLGCLLVRVEEDAEISQSVVLRLHRAVECLKHQLIARLIEGELYAYLFGGLLQVEERCGVGYGNHHPVAIHIVHGASEREIFKC